MMNSFVNNLRLTLLPINPTTRILPPWAFSPQGLFFSTAGNSSSMTKSIWSHAD